jgi:ADP-L-glycero-D-manno-heptose 6-epimerase
MLLEECIKRNVPFVYASSASVYGLGTNGFQEDIPLTPLNYYAISKASFDNFVSLKILDNPNAKIVGLRYFNVYGTGEDHKLDMSSPIHKFIKQSKEESEIRVFQGSENYKRDFIHVSDVVNITKNAPEFPSGIYNVGTGTPRSFLDVAQIVSNLSGAAIKEIPFPKHLEGKYQEFTCSHNKKVNTTGFPKKRKSLEDGINQVYTFISL